MFTWNSVCRCLEGYPCITGHCLRVLERMVLGTFPKAFSQGRLPKWQFSKWQLSKFEISHTATSQRLVQALWGAWDYNGGGALRLGWARGSSAAARAGWGPSAAARTDLGNCTFGKLPLGKIPLESCHLGKILWVKYLKSEECPCIPGILSVGTRQNVHVCLEYSLQELGRISMYTWNTVRRC